MVQVKGGNSTTIDANEYKEYVENGYLVYLYAPNILNIENTKNIIEITREDLTVFYETYKSILSTSITQWENLFQ